MTRIAVICLLCGIFAQIYRAQAEVDDEPHKRYIASLAKNGRLPQFGRTQKKDSKEEILSGGIRSDDQEGDDNTGIMTYSPEEKKAVTDFFRSRGKPKLIGRDIFDLETRKHIASLARTGKLNEMLYDRFNPLLIGDKRESNEDASPENETEEMENEIDMLFNSDCEDGKYDETFHISPQKKRYVAALARSGRLPIWHSPRMWGTGKRDDSRSNEDGNIGDHVESNIIDATERIAPKNKRCKKLHGMEALKRVLIAYVTNKNLPALRIENGKQNYDSFVEKGDIPTYNNDNKRNRALQKGEKFSFVFNPDEKRNIQAMARKGKLPYYNYLEEKRNVQALARNGNLPYFSDDKRNIQAMARNGKLLFNSYLGGKRSEEEPDWADDVKENNLRSVKGKVQFGNHQDMKRNLAAMARNGKLRFNTNLNFKRDEDESESEYDIMSKDKPSITELFQNGNFLQNGFAADKKNVAALARNGYLPYKDGGK